MEIIAILIPVVIFYGGAVLFVGYLIFSPFKDVIRQEPVDGRRLLLTDLLAVFVPFQLGFAAINWIWTDIVWSVDATRNVSVLLLLLTTISWFYGLRLLWRTEARHWFKRLLFLSIGMPAGIVISIIAVPLTLGLLFQISESQDDFLRFIFSSALLVTAIFLLRQLCHWVLVPDRKVVENARNSHPID